MQTMQWHCKATWRKRKTPSPTRGTFKQHTSHQLGFKMKEKHSQSLIAKIEINANKHRKYVFLMKIGKTQVCKTTSRKNT